MIVLGLRRPFYSHAEMSGWQWGIRVWKSVRVRDINFRGNITQMVDEISLEGRITREEDPRSSPGATS